MFTMLTGMHLRFMALARLSLIHLAVSGVSTKKVCKEDKEYAYECAALAVKWVVRNGGVIEQPLGSGLFRAFGLRPNYRVFLSDFGYPAKKCIILYSTVKLTLPALHAPAVSKFEDLAKKYRDVTPLEMAKWLIDSLTLL